jgi:hypothetical protein
MRQAQKMLQPSVPPIQTSAGALTTVSIQMSCTETPQQPLLSGAQQQQPCSRGSGPTRNQHAQVTTSSSTTGAH